MKTADVIAGALRRLVGEFEKAGARVEEAYPGKFDFGLARETYGEAFKAGMRTLLNVVATFFGIPPTSSGELVQKGATFSG